MKHLVRGLFCLVLAGLVLPLFAAGRNQREDEPIILTVWDFKYGEAVTGRAFREIDELFMRENPGITINHVAQPESNYYPMILSAFLARTNVDMVMIHGTEQAYEMADFYEVLNPYMTAEDMASLLTSALVGSSPNGDYKTNLRALPLTIQGVGIYYNKTLLANAGFDISKSPANWANFTAACESLKNAGITPIIFGNSGGETSLGYMYSIILQTLLGPRLENLRDGTVNFRSLEFRKATLMIQEMYDTRMDKS